jgi:hypothetical protein
MGCTIYQGHFLEMILFFFITQETKYCIWLKSSNKDHVQFLLDIKIFHSSEACIPNTYLVYFYLHDSLSVPRYYKCIIDRSYTVNA